MPKISSKISYSIVGKKVSLRPLGATDAVVLRRWLSDPEVARFLNQPGQEPILSADRRWLTQIQRATELGRAGYYAIIETKTDLAIGVVAIVRAAHQVTLGLFGIMIGEQKYWGQGYGTEAGDLALRLAFQRLKLHRVYLEVAAYNLRAIRSYRRLGFRIEGALRQHLFRDGVYHDVVCMGLLREEDITRRKIKK